MFKLSYIIECAISAVQILPHLFEKISADLIEIIKNFLLCLFDQFYIVHTHILSTFDISILSSVVVLVRQYKGLTQIRLIKSPFMGLKIPVYFFIYSMFVKCNIN